MPRRFSGLDTAQVVGLMAMTLSEQISAIEAHAEGLDQLVKSLRESIRRAQDAWPDHQIVPCFDWHSRNETPPAGMVWASNGTSVWPIRADGSPIPKGATAVLYWTTAFIPTPPDLEPRIPSTEGQSNS